MAKPYTAPEGVYALFILEFLIFTEQGIQGQIKWDGKRYGNLASAEQAQGDLEWHQRVHSWIWVYAQNETIPVAIVFNDSRPVGIEILEES